MSLSLYNIESIIDAFKIRNPLFINFSNLKSTEIKDLLAHIETFSLASQNYFQKKLYIHYFSKSKNVNIFSLDKIAIKKYDALFTDLDNIKLINNVLTSFPSIQYAVVAGADDSFCLDNFDKLTEGVFKRSSSIEMKCVAPTAKQKMAKKCSFAVVNYNTSFLVNSLIKSIKKFVRSFEYDIWIFDNSDKEKLVLDEQNENVHVIDNTDGKYIDYSDKGIAKYVDFNYRKTFKNFISFRHAIALQWLIDYDKLSDNIILCDSDVLLKKDIDFIDENAAACGKIEGNVSYDKRLVPYLCYLNRAILKKNNIRYFNQNFMHGCKMSNGKTQFMYDTGRFVLDQIAEKKLGLKQIDIYSYCIHFKAKSRTDVTSVSNDKVVETIKSLNLNKEEKTVEIDYSKENSFDSIDNLMSKTFEIKEPKAQNAIYTCITGGFDKLIEDQNFDFDNFDYICFTDNLNLKSDNWKVVYIQDAHNILHQDDPRRIARYFKAKPHLFLSKYKSSIWIDGNMHIKEKNLIATFYQFLGKNGYILLGKHPKINDVFTEILCCKKMRKDAIESLDKIEQFLRLMKFNNTNEHIQTGVILRKHNNKTCINAMNAWWRLISLFSKRDQTSFNYAMKSANAKFTLIPWKEEMEKFFVTNYIHAKKN